MKKLFVSVPMKNRTEEAIKASIAKMKALAEAFEGEELELIDSYVEGNPPENGSQSIWYLGKSLELLSKADVFIGINNDWRYTGCMIERDTAQYYGIKSYHIDLYYIAPDRELVESCDYKRKAEEDE